jgi:catechol 2,3-dioxygenase-like lactoylglutathione lyase family enzyme
MGIARFDHYTIRCADLDASWRFYEAALGLSVRKREGFPVAAFIASAVGVEVVHAFQANAEVDAILRRIAPRPEGPVNWSTARLQHVEFWATGLAEMKDRWTRSGVEFSERTLPDKHQVGLRDPDDIMVNLNFPLAEVSGV